MADINLAILSSNITYEWLNILIKRQRLSDWEKKIKLYTIYVRLHYRSKYINRLKGKKINHVNSNYKKADMVILTSDKIDKKKLLESRRNIS